MGVWIETNALRVSESARLSHPVWVCGLKQARSKTGYRADVVTPCMGVWIETQIEAHFGVRPNVTPCMGVWIETQLAYIVSSSNYSHTLYGCVD